MANPNPVPPYCRVVDVSACSNSPKNRFALFRSYANSGIGDRKNQVRDSVGRRSPSYVHDDFALVGELDGIGNQIYDRLPQSADVAEEHAWYIGTHAKVEIKIPFTSANGQALHRRSQFIAQVKLDRIQVRAYPLRSWRNRGCR